MASKGKKVAHAGKKRVSAHAAAAKAAPAKAKPAPREPWWALLAIGLTGVVAYVLLAPVLQPVPALMLPLVVGVYLGLVIARPLEAAGIGAAVATLGGVLSAWLYSAETANGLLQRFPQWANIDVPGGTYTEGFAPLIRLSPWLTDATGTVLLGVVLCGLAAGLLAMVIDGYRGVPWLRTAVGWAFVVLLAGCFLASAETGTTNLRSYANVEPQAGGYQYDAVIYLKTFYLMKHGESFYPAAVEACSGDARLAKDKVVRDGKMFGFWPKPSYFRQPLPFWMWTASASDGAGIVRLAEVLCAVLLLAMYAGFGRSLSVRAAIVPMLLFPWLLFHILSLNTFFPDWWAALFSMFALALLAARVPLGAIAAALVASLTRFNALPLLAVLVASAGLLVLVRAERKRALVLLGAGLAACAVFVVAWQVHVRAATPFIDPATMAASTDGGILSGSGRPFEARALAPLYYLMFPYGFGVVPLLALFPLAFAGFGLGLRQDRYAQLAGVLFALGWFAFLMVAGPSSSYWGQVFTGFLVAGTAVLLAEVPRADEAWRDAVGRWRAAFPTRDASAEEVAA